jgi:hypothetical protein
LPKMDFKAATIFNLVVIMPRCAMRTSSTTEMLATRSPRPWTRTMRREGGERATSSRSSLTTSTMKTDAVRTEKTDKYYIYYYVYYNYYYHDRKQLRRAWMEAGCLAAWPARPGARQAPPEPAPTSRPTSAWLAADRRRRPSPARGLRTPTPACSPPQGLEVSYCSLQAAQRLEDAYACLQAAQGLEDAYACLQTAQGLEESYSSLQAPAVA